MNDFQEKLYRARVCEDNKNTVAIDLTRDEMFAALQHRGCKLTRLPLHGLPFGGPHERYYYWPMGEQPDENTILLIGATDPLTAAYKYLDVYLPGGKDWEKPRRMPKVSRPEVCPCCLFPGHSCD